MAFVSSELPAREREADDRGDERRAAGPTLSWEDIGFFGRAMAVAPKQWGSAGSRIREEYSLGPRGPWIVGLIEGGDATTPSDLTNVFQCGRSLITAELNRLADAGLITTHRSDEDGRQVRLRLTDEGKAVRRQVGEALVVLLGERLAGYTREDVLLCARLLRDFARGAD